MKRTLLITITLFILLVTPSIAFAQGMMGNWGSSPSSAISDDHTAREEAEGKEIREKLQAKQLECKNLTDDNYEVLGEYFMGQMAGDQHEAMNNMMIQMMGKQGEEQIHVVMGKRLSGCDTRTKGGGNPMMGYRGWGNMMGGWDGGFGIFGWITMIAFWLLLILGIIVLIRYLGGLGKRSDAGRSPLDILKERYARGEIDKKEFEEMKKELR